MRIDISSVTIDSSKNIREAMNLLNETDKDIVLVIDENDRLIGTITDGDIRRGLLRGLSMDTPIDRVIYRHPIVTSISMPKETIIELMKINGIRHLPIVDEQRRLVGLEYQAIDNSDYEGILTAVIMVGGGGKRLRPLTEDLPKPMLEVGGQPILEILIESLRNVGFKRIFLAVCYLCHIIEDYFNNGSDFGVDIRYIRESKPLGTAGGLGLIPDDLKPKSPFLVINGDLLTDLNFKAFLDFHIASHYDFTICGRPYKVQIPFGYPVVDGDFVVKFQEKPEFTYLVNSGIYCISPELLDEVPVNEYLNMPALIQRALQLEKRVGMFPLRENFHEIGRLESYEAAEEFYQKNIEPKLKNSRKL